MVDFIADLQEKLKAPLPGQDAHIKMMPKESARTRFDEKRMAKARLSSVLILFYEKNGAVHIPLTQRHDYEGTHSGQVSFPGGKWEPDDVELVNTAKRETREEIGVPEGRVEVIGQLSDIFIPPSNFKVSPFVSYTPEQPDFIIDDREVKELLEVPVDQLLDEAVLKRKDIKLNNGFKLNAPYFELEGKVVWGATAMMLSELKTVLLS